LNQRLPAPKAGALPGCATPRAFDSIAGGDRRIEPVVWSCFPLRARSARISHFRTCRPARAMHFPDRPSCSSRPVADLILDSATHLAAAGWLPGDLHGDGRSVRLLPSRTPSIRTLLDFRKLFIRAFSLFAVSFCFVSYLLKPDRAVARVHEAGGGAYVNDGGSGPAVRSKGMHRRGGREACRSIAGSLLRDQRTLPAAAVYCGRFSTACTASSLNTSA
jgi:hypothetical protein